MDSIYSVGSTSSSHTYGNLIEAAKDDILSKFPRDYFKYIHISSNLAFRQIKKYTDNSLAEMKKREKPLIIIKPAFEVGDDSIPFRMTPLMTNIQASPYGMSRRSLIPFVKDHRKHYSLMYRLNRDRISFEVNIQSDTLVRQLDLYKAMENNIAWNGPTFQNRSLETAIPYEMVNYISKIVGYDLDKSNNNIPIMIQYLQNHSSFPITYKIRNATSNPDFFMYRKSVPVIVTYSDLSIDDGSKKGMTDDVYNINFKVTMEFNLPGAFVLIGDNSPDLKKVKFNANINNNDGTDTFIPIYTMEIPYEDETEVAAGFKLYTSTIIKTEKENLGKDDILDLNEVIETCYLDVAKKYATTNMDTSILFKVKLYKDKDLSTDVSVDWSTGNLYIHKSDPYTTYRVMIYMNHIRLTEEIMDAEDKLNNDKTYDYYKK